MLATPRKPFQDSPTPAGNPAAAKSALTNYMNYVKSQSGAGINAAYATRLVNWAQDLYNRL